MDASGVFLLSQNGGLETADIYQDLLVRLPGDVAKLRSATGDRLPDVSHELIKKARFEKTSEYLGALASRASFSTVTGCWSIMKGRNSKGYVQIYGTKQFGIDNSSTGRNYGIGSHRLAYMLMRQEDGYSASVPPELEVDHICRNTACCNPGHLRGVDKLENNELKNKAKRIESALAIGQLMLGRIGIGWFDKTLINAEQEDTGMVVSTRFGPHRVFKISDDPLISYAVREPCEVFDALQKPPTDNRRRKSRAKLPFNNPLQESFI